MMTRHKLTTTVSGRSKNVFGIYKKLNTKKITFNELYDLIGVRIIVDSIQDCYIALGLLHEKFKPVSDDLKIIWRCQNKMDINRFIQQQLVLKASN